MDEPDAAPNAADQDAEDGATFRLAADPDGAGVQLTAEGADAATTLAAGLRGLLAFAKGDAAPGTADETRAVPVAGRGPTLAALFAALADDLLAQLDVHGTGPRTVRMDGLLRADDGGWSAWGYLVGGEGPPPRSTVSLSGAPEWDEEPGRAVLRCTLRRE